MLRIFILTTTSILIATDARNSIKCSEPSQKCVPIKECQPVMKLLRSRPALTTYNEVRQNICAWQGNDPSVCCEAQFVNIEDQIRPLQHLASTVVNRIQHHGEHQVQVIAPERVDPSHPSLQLLNHELCGPVSAEMRIHGGSPTRLFEFPWMGLLAYQITIDPPWTTQTTVNSSKSRPDFRCGASIINEKYLMTAAHCVAYLPKPLKLVGVRVGEYNLDTEFDCETLDSGASICAEKYQDLDIKNIHIHANYSPTSLQNDIALIRIKGRISFRSTSVRPICLPLDPVSMLSGIRFGVVTGWGSREGGVTLSNRLLKVRLPIKRAETCEKVYRDQPLVQLWYKQLCAGGEPGQDSCTGDSGGPLQTLIRYPYAIRLPLRYIQIGIVSFGRSVCAESDVPAVYTNIAHYLHWLLDNMQP
ncbi:hypothetical protein QAD02_022921 [Eretmocerus hayati]|uniref:Uncharacterized protein n=1 Tax=Eretmocerus hayati TaxID=131215 RepID=A0ACC2PUK4_9HYME|nr:hypothetical protein QAD02_022921 [Eretmocerus hayati]